MARAGKACNTRGCPSLQPCPDHPKVAWQGSTRRERTVSGWEQQRRAQRVLEQHDGICHVCKRPGSDTVDHVIPLAEGGPDTADNLRPIHAKPCHETKTQAEAQRARSRS